jgi:hypothetical protein
LSMIFFGKPVPTFPDHALGCAKPSTVLAKADKARQSQLLDLVDRVRSGTAPISHER